MDDTVANLQQSMNAKMYVLTKCMCSCMVDRTDTIAAYPYRVFLCSFFRIARAVCISVEIVSLNLQATDGDVSYGGEEHVYICEIHGNG